MTIEMMIRPELPADQAGIHTVHLLAFHGEGEARLVELLRANEKCVISLVAVENAAVLGHILFSPVSLADKPNAPAGLGLAPLAVVPRRQGQGIGSRLVQDGVRQARELGYAYLVVLGDPNYYSRFGFLPASRFAIDNEYEAGDAFMALELQPGALAGHGGLCQYAPEFMAAGV
jgi:putative acetyltransferase